MKFNQVIGTSLLFILILILASCGNNDSSNKTSADVDTDGTIESEQYDSMTIQLATVEADGHNTTEGAKKFKEIVEEKSGGQIKVDVYPNQQLGSMRDQTEMTQMGSIQMSITPVSTVGSFVDDLQILELPFLFNDEDVMWDVLDRNVGQDVLDTTKGSGLKGLGLWAGGFKQITSNKKPIESPEDMKGLDIRVIPSESLINQYKAWGANPTPIDFAELYTSLQQGVVDAEENPLVTILSQKFYEVQKYLTISNHAYQFHMIMANESWFDSLNENVQQLLVEAEKEAREFSKNMNQEQNAEQLQALEDEGIEVNELSSEAIKQFQELSTSLYKSAASNEEKAALLKEIQDAVKE